MYNNKMYETRFGFIVLSFGAQVCFIDSHDFSFSLKQKPLTFPVFPLHFLKNNCPYIHKTAIFAKILSRKIRFDIRLT